VTRVISPPKDSIMVTGDLPTSFEESSQLDLHDIFSPLSFPVDLKIIFLSRISREKNLDLALQMLMKVEACIVFDIYGPIEDASYWLKCQKMILELPPNITVRYCKIVPPSKILGTFSAYDLFLFPTGGEAYGNVIAESLIAGTQVLISKNTPWRNLEVDSLGWDIDLNMIDSFVDIIEAVALTSSSDRLIKRDQVKNSVNLRLTDSWVLESNLKLLGIRCYEK
jgi:glycosyltransferase involved in cell wall biosynthesis